MPTIGVVHAPADREFIERSLLPLLPGLGFDRSIIGDIESESLENCTAIVVVISSNALAGGAIASARASRRPLVGLRIGVASWDVRATLANLSTIDATELTSESRAGRSRIGRELGDLLPSLAPPAPESASEIGMPIAWSESVFSEYLADASEKQDVDRVRSLVGVLEGHLKQRTEAYPAEDANKDLNLLRKKRQFDLLCRAGEMIVQSGTTDFTTLRLYAQGLIELKRFGVALRVLKDIIARSAESHPESLEARGLVGRLHKQQYVDDPAAPDAAGHLRESIAAYSSVYEKHSALWHGINTSSLSLRGDRDGLPWADAARGLRIAKEICVTIESQRSNGTLKDAWDLATWVEALVNVDDFDGAETVLGEYLAHPDMDAFEVSSTHRQFEEVLELGSNDRGAVLLDRLWKSVERFRAGGLRLGEQTKPMLVRVTSPDWQPGEVPNLTISARSGTIVSILGSRSTVEALLKDPRVIAVEESRVGAATLECRRSVPFVRAGGPYTGLAAPFEEHGAHAIVAIIDDGIDVLHKAFTTEAGKSRIIGIWDQRDEGRPPAGFSFGREHSRDEIAGYLADPQTLPASLGRNSEGHGTHVASIAAGRATGGGLDQFGGGVAPEAKVVVVITKPDAVIGYSLAHLAALEYIANVAANADLPVVVNLSQGMNAGGHDGRSALETAFDRFSETGRKAGYVIVKSAGNEREKNAHAEIPVAQGALVSVRWIHYDGLWDSERLEFWWKGRNNLRFRLGSPAGDWSTWIGRQEAATVKGTLAGGDYMIEYTQKHVDNGDGLLRIDVSDITEEGFGRPWTVQIEGVSVTHGDPVHAWIERTGGPIPSAFQNHLSEKVTLTIPATAESVIAVGAIRSSIPLEVGDFSSFGPTRDNREKPEVSAPGVDIDAAKAGTEDGCQSMSGTSMAAPHVTGAIALALSRRVAGERPWLSANQLSSVLQERTTNNSGVFDPGSGFGAIDVAAFLKACEEI